MTFQKGHQNFVKNPHKGPHKFKKTHCRMGHERIPENLYGSNGRLHTCKLCHKLKAYEWKRTNELKKYGMTREDWNGLFEKQNGKCAICLKHQSELKQRLVVDHEHKSGKVRALLCHACNLTLGNSYEDASILQRCIAYLQFHRGELPSALQ